MDNEQLKYLQEFVRICREEANVSVEVGLVIWKGPHQPKLIWQKYPGIKPGMTDLSLEVQSNLYH